MRLMGWRAAWRAIVLLGAMLAFGAIGASAAGATTYSWSVSMSGSQEVPPPPGGQLNSGSASLTGDTATNRLCGTFSWSGGGGLLAAHIHVAQSGEPETPLAITVAGPSSLSPVSGCAIVPGPVMTEMARFPQLFNVELHTTAFPTGAMRGQLGSGTLKCELDLCPGP
jgi:hypothetical protein